MGALADKLAKQVADLQAERRRIVAQNTADLTAVDAKIDALVGASGVISDELEETYAALLKLGLISEVTR